MRMADDKIFFDEQALSVVDSWLGVGTAKKEKATHRISTTATGAPSSKVGLGFKGKVAEAKVKDALQVRLEKSQKKKTKSIDPDDEELDRKHDDDDDDDDDTGLQLHGIVEDMPLSRTQIFAKPIVVSKAQPKKKAAVELINGNLIVEKKTALPVAEIVADSHVVVEKRKNENLSTVGDEHKRKRTKTRSKQKNIRRDNRPDSQKPSYITDTQAEDYRGRDLTEVRFEFLSSISNGLYRYTTYFRSH